jgi:protein phosphatase
VFNRKGLLLTDDVNFSWLKAVVKSDTGRVRQDNQDAYGFINSESYRLFIVADGMGGALGGAFASRLAIDTISLTLQDKPLSKDLLKEAIIGANAAIFSLAATEGALQGMGTTVVLLAIMRDQSAFIGHVGDSRAYAVLGDSKVLKRLTIDHTVIEELLRNRTEEKEQGSEKSNPFGFLQSPTTAQLESFSHILTRSVGPLPEVEAEVHEFQLTDFPTTFLLCSDGLYNHLSDSEICDVIKKESLEEAVDTLVTRANMHGGNDNITALLIHVERGTIPEKVVSPKASISRGGQLMFMALLVATILISSIFFMEMVIFTSP